MVDSYIWLDCVWIVFIGTICNKMVYKGQIVYFRAAIFIDGALFCIARNL